MFKLFTKKKNELDKEIDYLVSCLRKTNPAMEGYSYLIEELERLSKIRDAEKAYSKVKKDTLVNGLFHIGGILLVLNFEKLDVVISKAFNQATRWRV